MEKNKKNEHDHNDSSQNTEVLTKETPEKETPEKEASEKETTSKKSTTKDTSKKETSKKETKKPEKDVKHKDQKKEESGSPKQVKKEFKYESIIGKEITALSSEHVKVIAVNALKILLPVAACAIVLAVIFSYAGAKKSKEAEQAVLSVEENTEAAGTIMLSDEPLEENAHEDVNQLMQTFYTALAEGDIEQVKNLKDYNDDTEIITYEKKSEFIESYDNINCYTKPGMDDTSYFVYVSYDVKVKDIETKAPGLNAFYVYTSEDGSLKIDGNLEESITAAFKLVTNQDDVVDLYNKIDVSYNEAIASDEALNSFMTELPTKIKTSVGEALAQLETQNTESSENQTETSSETQTAETEPAAEEQPQNQTVNQLMRVKETVNVRSSDSEEADKIGKADAGTEITRIEDRVNGWSKVIFDGKEAYIKSDYLEVITTEATSDPIGSVKATTNVNVRSAANQDSSKLGTAQAGNTYDLLEDQGEWYKINFDGNVGYVKSEFFEK